MILGIIDSIDIATGIKLIVDGENEPTQKKYTYLSSYVPVKGDKVLIEEIAGTYVILGKIISNYNQSGKARNAETSNSSIESTNSRYVRNNGVSNGTPITFNATSTGLQVIGNGFNFKLVP
ncbi:MAG: hypothetical protein ACK5L6_01190 [Anaerorhabdus sp.]|uniref:hypothetical protein n=1 Tax=Anaerorhabdus sp. TaxID=1872524 RepID=UPI003A869264